MRSDRTSQQPSTTTAQSRRHLAVAPEPGSARGFRARVRAHFSAWWPVWVVAVVSRMGVVIVGFLSQYAATNRGIADVLPFARSGTFVHYEDVVLRGYSLSNAYEFPLYPAMLSAAHGVGIPLTIASLLISAICCIVGSVAMAVLGERYVGRTASTVAATYLLLWPTSHFFSLASTESVMLLTSVAAVIFALRGSTGGWLLAAPCAAACALTRPPGALIGVVLLGIAIGQLMDGRLRRPAPLIAALAAGASIPAAVFAFFWYLRNVTGDFQAALHAQEQFGRSMSLTGPWAAVSGAVNSVRSGSIGPAFELAAVALAVGMLAVFALKSGGNRSERWGWVAFGVCSLLLPLSTGLVWQMPRFTMMILPVFWAVGIIGTRWKPLHAGLLVILPMALAFRVVFEVVGVHQ